MTLIINYKIGNLGSISNMFRKIGTEVVISSGITDIEKAKKIVLPGVGSFDNGMNNLKKLGEIPILNRKVLIDKTQVLGICLGMQLFAKKSGEGKLPGLGWIDGEVVRFKFKNDQGNLKVPHMGWNTIKIKKDNILLKDMYQEMRFYFAHSYYLACNSLEDILATTNYGYEFPSIIQKENIFGVQFHPEKSHKFGMIILKNFSNLC